MGIKETYLILLLFMPNQEVQGIIKPATDMKECKIRMEDINKFIKANPPPKDTKVKITCIEI